MEVEVKIIENRETGRFRITSNGIDVVTYTDNERDAKGIAFDEALNQQMLGNKVILSYLSY